VALVSSSAGTTSGAPDFSLGSVNVDLTGRIYAPAVAQVDTPTVNFGIVRVGDVVTARTVSVGNSASGALTDTLTGNLTGGSVPFTAAGSFSGLAAGAGNSSALTVALNTATAGVFSSNAALAFTSQNPDLADLNLPGGTVALSAQVNRLAQAALAQIGGAGTLAGAGTSYTLNFGTYVEGSGSFAASLSLGNIAAAPADDLNGSFDLSGIGAGSAFTLVGFNGFNGFNGLAAGNSLAGGQSVSFTSGRPAALTTWWCCAPLNWLFDPLQADTEPKKRISGCSRTLPWASGSKSTFEFLVLLRPPIRPPRQRYHAATVARLACGAAMPFPLVAAAVRGLKFHPPRGTFVDQGIMRRAGDRTGLGRAASHGWNSRRRAARQGRAGSQGSRFRRGNRLDACACSFSEACLGST